MKRLEIRKLETLLALFGCVAPFERDQRRVEHTPNFIGKPFAGFELIGRTIAKVPSQ